MAKMLDLSVFQEKTLDIKMLDGSMVKIKKPSQALVIEVMKLRNLNDNDDAANIVDAVSVLVQKILNSNTEEKAFPKDWIESNLDFNMCMAVIQAYGEFITEVQSDPN